MDIFLILSLFHTFSFIIPGGNEIQVSNNQYGNNSQQGLNTYWALSPLVIESLSSEPRSGLTTGL